MSKTISDQIEKTELLINGLRKNLNLIADKGIDAHSIDEMEALSKKLAEQNKKVETLRVEVAKEAKKAREQYDELRAKFGSVKRILKLSFPQEKWQNLGVFDKR